MSLMEKCVLMIFITHSLNRQRRSNSSRFCLAFDSSIDDDQDELGTPELLQYFCGRIEFGRTKFVDDLPEQRECLLTMAVGDVLRCDVAENLIFRFFESLQCEIDVVYLLQA